MCVWALLVGLFCLIFGGGSEQDVDDWFDGIHIAVDASV